jgi:hypothetical protein
VTPALVVVLCYLLGAHARVLSNFVALDLITALYAFGIQVADCIESFRNDGDEKELDTRLSYLKIVRVANQIQRGIVQGLFIPRVTSSTTWSNEDNSAFANVVSPYKLYQTRSYQGQAKVELLKEVSKCGLLASQTDDLRQIGLRAVCSIWQGNYDGIVAIENALEKTNKAVTRTAADALQSDAYPFNLLYSPSAQEELIYLHVEKDKVGKWIVRDDNPVELPEISDVQEITYILSTNAPEIRFDGPIISDGDAWTRFKFDRRHLLPDGRDGAELNVDSLKPAQQNQWKAFKATLLPNVRIKFLFT